MTAYRDRYADIEKAGAKVIGVSADDAETLKKFRDSLKSRDTFVSDEALALIKRYDVKYPLLGMAQRTTFVIGPGMKVLSVISGGDAVNPDNSVRACTFPRAPDAGVRK